MKIYFPEKTIAVLLFIITAATVYSQTFTEQTGVLLPAVNSGSSAWGDYNNDGYPDLLVSGIEADNSILLKVYRNTSGTLFTDLGDAAFIPAVPDAYSNYSITFRADWADLNNDNLLDIISAGPGAVYGTSELVIYKNNGNSTFSKVYTSGYLTFQGGSSFDCGDYDNDGDQDIVLANSFETKILKNLGAFVFSKVSSVILPGMTYIASEWIDHDNDGDLDLVLAGQINWSSTSYLFRNDGPDSFTRVNLNSSGGFFDIADYNNDGYIDILLGSNVLKNNSGSSFTKQYSPGIPYVNNGDGKWGDLDNDGDNDIIITGSNTSGIFLNNGDNTFSALAAAGLAGLSESSVSVGDYDSDGDLDIVLSGTLGPARCTKLYRNESTVTNPAPAVAPTGITATISGNDVILSWNQVTTDNTAGPAMSYNLIVGTSSGSSDILNPNSSTTGYYRKAVMGNGQLGTSLVLRNLQKRTYYWKVQAVDNSFKGGPFSSQGTFTYNSSFQSYGLNVAEPGATKSTLSWTRGNGANCIVFMKEGNSGTATPLNGINYSASPVFKSGSQIIPGWYCIYKGTGSSVQVTGLTANTSYIFQVFEYEGASPVYNTQTSVNNPFTYKTGLFTDINAALLPVSDYAFGGSQSSSTYWFDSDNDNDLDLLLLSSSGNSHFYINNGTGFTAGTLPVSGAYSGSFGDYDNDGYVDIIFNGNTGIYRNNQNNTFTKQAITIPDVSYGPVGWNDYDNDGDLDFVISGDHGSEGKITRTFRQNSDGSFAEQELITFDQLGYGALKWGDFDNDGFDDIVISGATNSATELTALYRNNGKGNFMKQNTSFIASTTSTIDHADYDGDGDLDLLIGDFDNTKLYKNEGGNNFTEQAGVNLIATGYGTVAWGDYDNDGDPDILLAGFSKGYKPATKIYINNGDNTFSEDLNSVLPGAGFGSAAWGDYDNDGDLDIIVAGTNADYAFSKIFRNDINTVNARPSAPSSPSSTVSKSDVTLKWRSIRSDNTTYKSISYNLMAGSTSGAVDVLSPHSNTATGFRRIVSSGNAGTDTIAFLRNLPIGTYYWKVQAVDNGYSGGSFSVQNSFQIVPVQASSLSASIIDRNTLFLKWERGNGDRCAVFCKQASSGNAVPVNNASYIADSEFGFGGQIGTSGWYCVFNGRADSVIVKGLAYEKEYSFHVIEYNGSYGNEDYFTAVSDGNPGVFTTSLFAKQAGILLPNGYDNPPAWGDYDNDGFIDVLLPGNPTKIFRNMGNNTFTEVAGLTLPTITFGSASWCDYDNDNDLDFIISGGTVLSYPPSDPVTRLYRNDGSGIFTLQSTGFDAVCYSSNEWCDYNGDGFQDLLLTGATGTSPSYNPVSKIYKNNGNGTFTAQPIQLTGVYKGTAKWGDYDNDGDPDIILGGVLDYDENNATLKIYKNNGDNSFQEQTIPSLEGYPKLSLSWGDFDNDSDPDLLVSSYSFAKIYENRGNNQFQSYYYANYGFQDAAGTVWWDYDNDGYLDVIATRSGLNTEIYRNETKNGGTFNRQDDEALSGTGYRFVSTADYDNDGDVDFILTKSGGSSLIFRNNLVMKSGIFRTNSGATSPSGLTAVHSPDKVTLKWTSPDDDITPSKALTYNIMLGTVADSQDLSPSNSGITGYRKIVEMGNAHTDTTYVLRNLPTGTYYWKVQAVDQGFKGGTWSPGSSFEVKTVQTFFSSDEVCQGLPTHFTDQSVATAGIISWKWDFKDGTVSTLQNPAHSFTLSGTYNVKLVITDAGGTRDSLEQAVIVKPKPLTAFSAASVCQGIPVTATNTTDNNGLTVTSWIWDFGDGNISALQQPAPHPYLNAADYTIKLKAIASNGCADSLIHEVSVGSYPVAAITADAPLTFCKGDSVNLTVPLVSDYSYNWKMSGTSITGASGNRLVAKSTGSYTVEIINPRGNCTSVSPPVIITALEAPIAPAILTDGQLTFCQGDSVKLSVPAATGNQYYWKLNGGAVGANLNAYNAKAAGEYSLTLLNSSGCSANSVNKITVAVNPKPTLPVISTSGVTTFCQGSSVELSVPSVAGNLYSWKNENGTVPGITTNSYTASTSGSYRVDIANSYGCAVTTLPVTVTVKLSPAKPVLSETNYAKGQCPGEEPVRLSADPVSGYRYLWYKNGLPQQYDTLSHIEFFESGNYKLAADLGGCTAESEIFSAEFPEGLPKPLIYAQGPTFWYLACSNTEAAKYRWYYNGKKIEGADKYFYLANYTLGNYQVSIANSEGCYTRSDIITIPPGYTGADDTEPFEGIKIYPNPSSGLFTIEMDNNIYGKLSLEIISPDGRKIRRSEIDKTGERMLHQVDLTGQPGGMYIINLVLNRFTTTLKILIE